MRNIVIIILAGLMFYGCKKSKFSSSPQLTFKSVSPGVLYPDQLIRFRLNFTDAEGDLEDSLYVEKVVTRCNRGGFVEKYKMPVFPTGKNTEGEIEVVYAHGINVSGYYSIGAPQCDFNDTCYFRFMLKDKAQNKSDTVNSSTFVIIKQ
jgi:hypothetical protein